MSRKFREHHLLNIFLQFSETTLPLDVFLRNYFRQHSSIGSHDRKFLSETVYGMIRWLGLIDYFCKGNFSWEHRYAIYESLEPESHLEDSSIPLHVRYSFPSYYFSYLVSSLGEGKAKEFCYQSNHQAPITIRANLLKTTRNELADRLRKSYSISLGSQSETALHFEHRVNFFGLPEFKDGLFEVQDEASQLVALHVRAKPGDLVLDYCSASGGKTLAFAPLMKNRGQIYLHDIRPNSLMEAKKRLKRAGIQNAQILHSDDAKKASLKGKMDWVLVDVPCSGSGTLRRNPDCKWKFQISELLSLIETQKNIFSEALDYVRPKGHIVYSTCSILPEENEKQLSYFLSTFSLQLVEPTFSTFPKKGEMDGFYAAVMQKL